MIINTPTGLEPWFDEKAIRRAAVTARIPTITTLSAARAAAEGIAALQRGEVNIRACSSCMRNETCGSARGRSSSGTHGIIRLQRSGGMLLHGIFPPITTPFYPDGKVYFKKLESNVEHYSRTPCAGIVVLGSTGEAILLSDEERRDVLKSAREAAAPNKVLIAGTGVESAIETLRLTEYAAELGYDVAMVRTPHYYKKQMQPANMLAFYRTVADRSPLPVIIYNFPQATGYDIPAELVIELAEHPNLIGIKESCGDVEKVRKMVEGTRHIKRSATVTETFDAVTPRMLAAASGVRIGDGGELVPVASLGGKLGRPCKPSSAAVTVVGKMKTRQKEVGFQVLVGRRTSCILRSMPEPWARFLLLPCARRPPATRFMPRGKKATPNWRDEAGAHRQSRAAYRRRVGHSGVKYAMDFNGYFGGPARLPLLPLTGDAKMKSSG